MKKMLLIIDPQYDFIEGGNLGVKGGTHALDVVNDHLLKHGEEYTFIALTSDWHPYNHCSFNGYGGIWNRHCVAHTQGASIYQPLLESLWTLKLPHGIFCKGMKQDTWEYSVMDNDISSEQLISIIEKNEIDEIVVCGLALDYCVVDSIKGLIGAVPSIKVLLDGTSAITEDGKEETLKFFKDNNIEVV